MEVARNMKDISDMRALDHLSRDGFDLVQDIDVLQRRLINPTGTRG